MGSVRIILASQSPRRRELLERMGILNFEIIPARGEEVLDPALPPERLVEELSRQKAAEVAAGAAPEAQIRWWRWTAGCWASLRTRRTRSGC